jgi:hypothetical protein
MRTKLQQLFEKKATVTLGVTGGIWTGRILALGEETFVLDGRGATGETAQLEMRGTEELVLSIAHVAWVACPRGEAA